MSKIGLVDVDGHNFPKEEWKPVVGYEQYAEVSNHGRIRTIAREYVKSNGAKCYVKSRISKTYFMDSGYEVVTIYLYDKGGLKQKKLVHRLVAEAFVANPNNLPQVNHLDENKGNNHYLNLEWCTAAYNLAYGTKRQRESKTKSKAINMLDMSGNLIRQFDSMTIAAKEMGLKITNISAACRKKKCFASAGGYKWELV